MDCESHQKSNEQESSPDNGLIGTKNYRNCLRVWLVSISNQD
ncbi:hypothetical protein BCL79_2496 [Stenotrophomonas rhizophila]|uniref:Uncharacterized protein n=1 Tax=Stenotrophomonas rhizophila TaxID=216778 RepID=A0A498CC21_9GAMM|nr:hypothetical protein BCL79_2496 [Stenotrophomonas rhizophila]